MSRVKICPVCGERNSEDAFDCQKCGELLIGPAQEELVEDPAFPAQADNGGALIHNRSSFSLSYSPDQAEDGGDPRPGSSATVVERKRPLRLEATDGSGGLDVQSGEILGREGADGGWFAQRQTVSRRHARVTYDGTQWLVEDLHSTNGTWINERHIEPGTPYPVKTGDLLALSRGCVFRVKG